MLPPPELQDQVSKLVARDGVEKTAALLELTEETTFRIANGEGVRPLSVKHAGSQLKLAARKT